MKKFIALFLAVALCFTLCACGNNGGGDGDMSADRNGDGEVVIAYSAIAYSIAVLPQYLYNFLKAGCEERGWTFQPLVAEGDPPLQGEQIEQLIQGDPDYFVLFPADPNMAIDWVESIGAAGIPCITLHTDVAHETDADGNVVTNENVSAYCGPDNYTMAANIAAAIIAEFGADAGLKIVEIGGVPVQSDYQQRVAGFDDYIAANSNYEVLALEWAYSNRANAQTIMENFISTYGSSIDILMGFDDDLTLGGVNALQEANMSDVGVYSITGQVEAIQAIKDGKMNLSAYYSTEDTVATLFKCIEDLADGKSIDYFQYTNIPHITATNADDYEGEF